MNPHICAIIFVLMLKELIKIKDDTVKRFARLSLPLYVELPSLNLYMDQVIDEVNQFLVPLTETKITKSMINSYVKQGLVDRPEKKRYSKQHLAEILVVSLMKPILSLDTIKKAIAIALKLDPVDKAYDQFIHAFNDELTKTQSQHLNAENYQRMAIRSLLYKLLVEEMVNKDL
ncbi:DUF1836 domain-containing protein [Lentilactobacillus hilgardii]|uniref:DUF1836 domain-containing protein n=1 Tax=Lentilactobacillus hilgardii TaxID=1588 RepID=UPI003FA5CD73